MPTSAEIESTEAPPLVTGYSYKDKVSAFVRRSNAAMLELFGAMPDDLETGPMTSPILAAKLILAYLDRDPDDKEWYKKVNEVTTGEGKLIVYTCHTGSIAHVGRALMVAEELRNLGATVLFAGDTNTMPDSRDTATQRKYARLIEEAGFEIFSTPTIDESLVMEHVQGRASWGFYTTAMIRRETEAQARVLEDIARREGKNPDIIITDFSPVMTITAEAMDIPVASMLNSTWTNHAKRRLSPPEAHLITRLFHFARLGWLADFLSDKLALTNILYSAYLIKWSIPYNIVRFQKGLRFIGNYYAQTQGDLVLMPDYAGLKGIRASSSVLPIGSLVWEPTRETALATLTQAKTLGYAGQFEEFEQFITRDSDYPLIYLTMGSSGRLELFQMVIEALKDKPYRVAITTGGQFDLGQLPDNFCAIPLYPGGLVCQRAALMISHGGSGSVYQAIKYGLPSLMLPTHADQQWNGDMLSKEEGLGQMILSRDLTPEKILEAVEALLTMTSLDSHGDELT